MVMEKPTEFTREAVEALGAPFPEDEIEFLPKATSGGMALGLPYIDARSVMRRLDAVVGPSGWSYDFELLRSDGGQGTEDRPGSSVSRLPSPVFVKGRLTVLGVTKCDAGEAGPEDEPLKSAVSDALKRCAVHFGIGRYLYYLPRTWAPFDAQKRRFIETPRLDPQAVQRALVICGYATPTEEGRPAAPVSGPRSPVAPKEPVSRPPSAGAPEAGRVREAAAAVLEQPVAAAAPTAPAAPEGEAAASDRKSIWAAGAAGRAEAGDGPRPGPRAAGGGSAVPESSGDRAASRPAPSGRPAESGATSGGMACSSPDCGKALTKGQHDVSVRAYGRPLCPACQKQHARSAA
jgi:hypothetical protein